MFDANATPIFLVFVCFFCLLFLSFHLLTSIVCHSYTRALQSATIAEEHLQAASVPYIRPDDYFAEMLKVSKQIICEKKKLVFINITHINSSFYFYEIIYNIINCLKVFFFFSTNYLFAYFQHFRKYLKK